MQDNSTEEQDVGANAMEALQKLARFRSMTDDALDIHLHLAEQKCPGSCLSCFFSLSRKAPSHTQEEVRTVREWLENQLEVVARNPDKCELCRFPCEIKETSMEEYCNRMMEETWHHFADQETLVSLELRYAIASSQAS